MVAESRFSSAFTFQYSKRPGTPAATLPDQVSPEVVKDRYGRLVDLVNDDRLGGEQEDGRAHRSS